MTRSSSAKSNSPSFGSICSHETLPRTVLKLEAANLDQTVSMYSEELRAEFCSSPPSMRKGRPLTSNCVDAPILWREGKLQIVVVFIVGKRVTLAGRKCDNTTATTRVYAQENFDNYASEKDLAICQESSLLFVCLRSRRTFSNSYHLTGVVLT